MKSILFVFIVIVLLGCKTIKYYYCDCKENEKTKVMPSYYADTISTENLIIYPKFGTKIILNEASTDTNSIYCPIVK